MYMAAYWIRFQGDRIEMFLPKTLNALPWVVGIQIGALLLAGAYAPRLRADWLARVTLGVVAGTASAAMVVGLAFSFEGVSRMVFVADAVLLTSAAIAWRGSWVLRARERVRTRARAARGRFDLVDRSQEMTTVGAVVEGLYAYRELLKNLVVKDLKLKYRGSVFGFLWSLANPLLMIIVYTIAFTFILRVRGEGFVFYLMLGQLAWSFFASSASMSTGAIVDNASLLKSVLFPRAILPIGSVMFNLAQYLLTLAVFLPIMMIWYRVPLSSPMMLFPAFLALQVIFTIGIALILSTATAFFRDVRHLLDVALAILFWTTPIVYELGQVPERLRLLILLSPISPFVVAYHELFFYRQWPEARIWLVAVTQALGAFAAGALFFVSAEDRFTEQL
jgi:ABC-2 type transport system permease protein